MKCGFCNREIDDNLFECPYCHYQIKKDSQVLSPRERDNFEGITIEEDGSTNDSASNGRHEQHQHSQQGAGYGQPKIKVKTFNFSSGLLLSLFIIGGILALFFFLLPAFLIFAAIGAVVIFIMKLFM